MIEKLDAWRPRLSLCGDITPLRACGTRIGGLREANQEQGGAAVLPSPRRFLFALLQVFALLSLLSACGGGGGSGDSSDMPSGGGGSGDSSDMPSASPRMGTVGVLITDAPTDQFSEINATITQVALLGEGAQRVIFSGSATLDLLALESHSDLFALAEDVEPGTFNQVRLTLSSLELVRRDAAGNVVERIRPDLPGNGQLDLSPRGSFSVLPGETLLIELDLDMEKSIHIATTGSQRVQFRPVIFVAILSGELTGRLARVSGTIEDIDVEARQFDLCAEFNSTREQCIEVFADDATGLFGPDGAPITFDALTAGEPATAVGRVRKHDDEDADEGGDEDADEGGDEDADEGGDEEDADEGDDEDADEGGDEDADEGGDRFEDDVRLDAVVVEAGDAGTFASLRGTFATVLDTATNRFDFTVAAGQGFAPDTTLSALVQDGTRIFSRDGVELDGVAIQVDQEARIDGVVQLSSTEVDTLRTALIVVDTQADAPGVLSGNILTLDAANGSFNMSTPAGDRCVRVPEAAAIFLITITESTFTSERGEFGDLVADQRVDVFGREEVDGCLVADVVLAQTTTA